MAQQSLYPIRWMSGGLPPNSAEYGPSPDGAQGLRFRKSYGCGREKRRARVTEAETTLP